MPLERREYLQRLILGLEQTIENLTFEIPYYKEGDLQGRYAQKFLEAARKNLAEARAELEKLDAGGGAAPGPKPPAP